MGKNSVSMEKTMTTVKVVSFLESIIGSLKEGKVVLKQGAQSVVLQPEKSFTVEVEASQKMDKGKLSINLKWKKPEEKQPETDIIVSSIEPEPVPEPEPKAGEKDPVEPKKTVRKQTPKNKKKSKAKANAKPKK